MILYFSEGNFSGSMLNFTWVAVIFQVLRLESIHRFMPPRMRKVALWWMWPLPLTTRSDFLGWRGATPGWISIFCVFVLTTWQICQGTKKPSEGRCHSETPSFGSFFVWLIPGSHRYDSGLHWRLASTEASAFEEPLLRCWGKRKGLSPFFCCWKSGN